MSREWLHAVALILILAGYAGKRRKLTVIGYAIETGLALAALG